jgi:[NiFe] hydrogenase diaphorase moiety small subunit
MSETIAVVVDGVETEGQTGETILEVADRAGLYIPRLCYHEDLVPHGSCRLCTVLVNGRPQTACTTPIRPGMIVENDTPELAKHRRNLIEMLLVEGNHFCMFCEKSGNCELQALAYRFGITVPKYPFLFPERDLDATHPDIFLDRNRCILCSRCVRASRDIDGKQALGFVGRSSGKSLAASASGGLGATGIEADDKAVQVCPVGALLRKRVGYEVPIGKRLYDEKPIGSDIENKREMK